MPADLLPRPMSGVTPARLPTPRSPFPITVHPRYERFLRWCGLGSAEAVVALRGEVVCGHPDRHVRRVKLDGPTGPRVVYLKVEHTVGRKVRFRNWRAGFGWVSRCEREAITLQRLEAAGLPGPQWLAYGTDPAGRAFLLVDEVPGAADLRSLLTDNRLSLADRRTLAERIGRTLAEIHLAGFATPELGAKHLLVHPRTLAVTLIDWQSAGRPGPVSADAAARQLAGLHASLTDDLAGGRERSRVLWAYRRVVRQAKASAQTGPRVRDILVTAARSGRRSSVRDQRQQPGGSQRLVWLAGEAVCVIPELADHWPARADGPPFYQDAADGPEWLTFRNGRRGLLARFRTVDPVGRLMAAVRERPWRSPAAVAARLLFHLDRYGVPGPRLLAFGQRLTDAWSAESFVLFEPPADGVPVPIRLREYPGGCTDRRLILADCGRVLRSLHDAGCRLAFGLGGGPRLTCTRIGRPRVAVGSPFAVRLTKGLSDADRRADLRALLRVDLPALSRAERCRVVRGYVGGLARSALLRRVV